MASHTANYLVHGLSMNFEQFEQGHTTTYKANLNFI